MRAPSRGSMLVSMALVLVTSSDCHLCEHWTGSAPTMYVPPEDILAELPRL